MIHKKTIGFLGMFLMLFLSLSMVSAVDCLELTELSFPSSVEEGSQAVVNFRLHNNKTGCSANKTDLNWTLTSNKAGSFTSVPTLQEIEYGAIEDLSATFDLNNGELGNLNIVVYVIAEDGSYDNETLQLSPISINEVIPSDSFCEDGALDDNDLTLSIDIKNDGEGEDSEDETWYPLDKIEVEVELENDKDEEIEDIVFELGLFKEGSNDNIAEDMIWISDEEEEIEIGDIEEKGEDDEISHTFEFRVNPDEIEDGTYYLKVKAYPDGDEDLTCIDHSGDLSDDDFGSSDFYAEISIDFEDEDDGRAVIVDIDELPKPIEAECGDTITLNVDIWNIGDKDQDQVLVGLLNNDLGLDLTQEIRDDVDQGEKQEITFSFEVPMDADETSYPLQFYTRYDYDDDDDNYDEGSDDTFDAQLRIIGNCMDDEEQNQTQEPTISAQLTSDAKVGDEMTVDVSITNNADETQSYLISPARYSSWAELNSISEENIQLIAGQSRTITMKFTPSESGTQTFDIQLLYNGNVIEQPVQVTISEQTGFLTGAFAGFGNNMQTYLIAGIFLLLLIIIVVLIIRLARKPRQSEF